MNHTNNNIRRLSDKQLDTLLKTALECKEKPDMQLKNQLLAAFQRKTARRRSHKAISVWWLPPVAGTLFSVAVFAAAPVFLSCFPLFLICVRAAALFFCADTWLITLIALKLLNLKEAALI